MRSRTWRSGLAFLAVLVGVMTLAPAVLAQEQGRPITIGHEWTLRSEILNEDRPISVHLPRGYDRTKTRYPVLYLLDGEAHFVHTSGITQFLSMGRIPQMIVIGITNTNRMRDLTPAIAASDQAAEYVPAGESAKFLSFLKTELIPFADRTFRTEPYRILAGHCAAGTFALHVMMAEPELFGAYLSITPYMAYPTRIPARYIGPVLKSRPSQKGFLHVTMGSEAEEWVSAVDGLANVIRETAPSGLRWRYRRLTDAGHGGEVHRAIYQALEDLYEGWQLPADAFVSGLTGVEDHYRRLSSRFGYDMPVPENTLNLLGYALLQTNRPDDAVAAFQRMVELYPDSWNAHDSLGEGYMTRGDKERAIAEYEKSLTLNPGNENGRRMLERLRDTSANGQ